MQLVALPWSINAIIARTFPTTAFRQHFRNQAKQSDRSCIPKQWTSFKCATCNRTLFHNNRWQKRKKTYEVYACENTWLFIDMKAGAGFISIESSRNTFIIVSRSYIVWEAKLLPNLFDFLLQRQGYSQLNEKQRMDGKHTVAVFLRSTILVQTFK
jgi:hypothetical protein